MILNVDEYDFINIKGELERRLGNRRYLPGVLDYSSKAIMSTCLNTLVTKICAERGKEVFSSEYERGDITVVKLRDIVNYNSTKGDIWRY